MDFKKLRTFQCAAQTLNFSEASNQLGYVQSAVTGQIKALEEELQVRLFERNGRGVALTPSGEHLYHYTQRLMALRDEARSVVSNIADGKPIQIGGHETVITYYLPKLLGRYYQENPDVRFSIQPTPVAKLKSDVLADNLDIAFILEKPFHRPGLTVHTYQAEDIVIVCSPNHPLAKKPSVQPHELADEHLLVTEKGCCYRNQFERVLINAGVFSSINLSEFVSIETIKKCVSLNVGMAALSAVSVEDELSSGALTKINLVGAGMSSNIHCVFNKKREYSEVTQRFLDYCTSFGFKAL